MIESWKRAWSVVGVVSATALVAVALTACGDGAGNDPLSPERQLVVGTVVLPSGVTAAEVVNGIAEAPVIDGGFTLEMFATEAGEDRQFTAAVSSTGDPMLMGWFGPEASELSPRTTAEVLAWFATGAFTAPLESADDLIALLGDATELDAVAAVIETELTANPDGFSDANPALEAALSSAVAALLPDTQLRSVLVNPGGENSGIRVDQVTGVNEITLTNRYRRPAFALVDRISTFDEQGSETASPAEIARLEVASVTGLEGGIGTINQIITGLAETGGTFEGADLAYTEKSAAPIALPNVEGAKKTRYQVAVVGPGASPGDYESLNDEAKLKQAEIVQEFVVKQLILPMVIQLLVPNSDLDRVANLSAFQDLVQDFINIITVQTPAIFDLANSGDFKGAVTLGGQTIVGSATFRNAIFAAVLEQFYDLRTEAGDAAYGRASAVASGFVNVTGALDTFLTAFDLTAVAGSFAQSNEADIWIVDAIDSQVRLSPPSTDLTTGANLRLTATTPDIGDDVPLAYRYSVTPTDLGELRNARETGTTIDSSEDFIYFDSGDTEGTVTVKVEVFQIDNANRIPLGDATATVTIEEGCAFGVDDIQTATVQKYVGIAEYGPNNVAAVAYWYFIWDLEPGIDPYDLTFHAGPAGDLFGNSVLHRDGNTIRIRPVQPIGQYTYRYSTGATLAAREADEFAAALALGDDQGIYILNDYSQGLNENQDQLEFFNEQVEVINAKQEGTTADFLPVCE